MHVEMGMDKMWGADAWKVVAGKMCKKVRGYRQNVG